MERRTLDRDHWRDRPGDLAPEGTPGTGEALCPHCGGQGRVGDAPCSNCDGTGIVIAGIGGA